MREEEVKGDEEGFGVFGCLVFEVKKRVVGFAVRSFPCSLS